MAELVFIIPCLFSCKPQGFRSSKYVLSAYNENLVFSMRYRPIKEASTISKKD